MADPLSEIIALLKPRAVFSKGISGAGAWAVRYEHFGHPSFCAVLEGRCRLRVDGEPLLALEAGDFVLLPATPGFVMSGLDPATPRRIEPDLSPTPVGDLRHGVQDGPPEVRLQGGYFVFDSPDAALLVSLLPALVHVRGAPRLSALVGLLGEEAASERAGRELVLFRLVEVLLVEALRAAPDGEARPGLLKGLADGRIAAALRAIHAAPARNWTMAELARASAMSRSAFFDRFVREVGAPPMEYLLTWRMALAKDLLRGRGLALDEVARRIGYGSASTFSTAFRRHVGRPPGRYAREAAAA